MELVVRTAEEMVRTLKTRLGGLHCTDTEHYPLGDLMAGGGRGGSGELTSGRPGWEGERLIGKRSSRDLPRFATPFMMRVVGKVQGGVVRVVVWRTVHGYAVPHG